MYQSYCVWKTRFPWRQRTPLALTVFYSPLPRRSLSLEGRSWMKNSHLVTFLSLANKITHKSSLGRKGFVWAPGLRLHSSMLGKAWQQVQEAGENTVSTVRKQGGTYEAGWYLCCCPPSTALVNSGSLATPWASHFN